MPIVCPTITANNDQEYRRQMELVAHLAHRIHIDLADGQFTPNRLLSPENAWWPVGLAADFHLMYRHPGVAIKSILQHQPHMIIIHAESDGDFGEVVSLCQHHQVKVGVALLPRTDPSAILSSIEHIDHVLIFSGNLGHQGGSRADLELLNKLSILTQYKPEIEIGWDGGINDQNISSLVSAGVDVLNVGGYIQHSEDPARAFTALSRIADETGTT